MTYKMIFFAGVETEIVGIIMIGVTGIAVTVIWIEMAR